MSNYQEEVKQMKANYETAISEAIKNILQIEKNEHVSALYNIENNSVKVILMSVGENFALHASFDYANDNMQINTIAYETVENGFGIIARPVAFDLMTLNQINNAIKEILLRDPNEIVTSDNKEEPAKE